MLFACSFVLGTFNALNLLPEVLCSLYIWAKQNFEQSFIKSAAAKTLILNNVAKLTLSQKKSASEAFCLSVKRILTKMPNDPSVRNKLFTPSFFPMPQITSFAALRNATSLIERKNELEEAVKQAAFEEKRWKERCGEAQIALGFSKQQEHLLLEKLRFKEEENKQALESLKKALLEKNEKLTSPSPSTRVLQSKVEKRQALLEELKKECKQHALDVKKAHKRLEEKDKELEQARLALFRMQEKTV